MSMDECHFSERHWLQRFVELKTGGDERLVSDVVWAQLRLFGMRNFNSKYVVSKGLHQTSLASDASCCCKQNYANYSAFESIRNSQLNIKTANWRQIKLQFADDSDVQCIQVKLSIENC